MIWLGDDDCVGETLLGRMARLAPLILWGWGPTQPMPLSPAKGRRGFSACLLLQAVLATQPNRKPLAEARGISCVVGMARFELATSWSQTRRDDRATLHPESISFQPKAAEKKTAAVKSAAAVSEVLAVREGFEPSVQSYPYGSLANY